MGNSKLENALAEIACRGQNEMIDNTHYFDFRSNIFGNKMDVRFIRMFLNGDGNELISKASSVKSSSMLGYNFFHSISKETPLTIDKIEYTDVAFEVKIPVINARGGVANMDIVLYNIHGDYLFIESKFLEYESTGPFKISDPYKNPKKYYNGELGNKWVRFINEYDTSAKKEYWPGIKQEICHLIGLSNWINGEQEIKINDTPIKREGDIRFINLIFHPDSNRFNKESTAFDSYKKLYESFHEYVEKAGLIPSTLKMEFKTYSELWRDIQSFVSPELKNYLEDHYMQFAANAD